MNANVRTHIHGISAEWDGAELELTMTSDAVFHFASALSEANGGVFTINSAFKGGTSLTKIAVEVASGLARLSVADDTITIKGGSNALVQIARNLLGLIALTKTRGVSHMHFDHVSDEDLIDSDSAGLIVSIAPDGT